jgi:hypothetical protein
VKKFWKDESGDFVPLIPMALAICIVLIMIVVILNGQVHAQYQEAEIFLERASNAAVDRTRADSNIRDIVLSINHNAARAEFERILVQENGFVQNGTTFTMSQRGEVRYVISNVATYVEDVEAGQQRFVVTGQISMLLPFNIGVPVMTEPIDITTRSRILYKEK